jgi:hypothetical protein
MLTRRVAVSVLLMLVMASAPAAGAERDAVPSDFSLRAEYYPALPHLAGPGTPRWYPWTLTLTADGRAELESNRTVPGKKKIIRHTVRVARREVARLVAEVRRANFHALAPEYAFEVGPASTLVLRITLDRRSHDVIVYGPERIRDKPEVAAFLRVWNQTLRTVPPLNPGQRPS